MRKPVTPPNVLIIMTDEHHYRVAGYAGDPVVQTAHLDRLAGRSTSFSSATCTAPICTPSRMSMLTGLEPHHCAGWSNHWVIFPELVTLPGHFADHGYATCLVGKMHFGGRDQMQGFQYRPYGDLRHGLGHQPDPLDMFPGYAHTASAGVTEVPASLRQDVVVSIETAEWVLEHEARRPDQPWLAVASYARPHAPLTAPGRYIDRYAGRAPTLEHPDGSALGETFARNRVHDVPPDQSRRARDAYYACVDYVDDCIGQLLDTLERGGSLDDTILVYTSDHGEMLGQHGIWGKQVYHDASLRVPLLIGGPGIPAGAERAAPFSLADLFPTLSALAGLPIPGRLDGLDLSPLVRGHADTRARRFATSAMYRYGVRINHRQVAEDAGNEAWRSAQDERWKYVAVERGAELLYDTASDPEEINNLAGDAAHRERLEELRSAAFDDFSWAFVHAQIARDRERIGEFRSGTQPTTPNQYMLPDGRWFDAEKSLYDARWLPIPDGADGGIIPQMFG